MFEQIECSIAVFLKVLPRGKLSSIHPLRKVPTTSRYNFSNVHLVGGNQ